MNLYNKIQNDPLVFPPHTKINPGLQDLLENMLRKDPNERFTLHKVIVHPWLRYAPAASSGVSPERVTSSGTPHSNTKIVKNQESTGSSSAHPPSIHFTPPESYDLEEAAAMEGPVKEVNHEDMYKSIGVSVVGKNKNMRGRMRNSSKDFTSNPSEKGFKEGTKETKEKETKETKEKDVKDRKDSDEGEGDMMLSGWGDDVFEMVDEVDGAGSDSDDDDEVDEESDAEATPDRLVTSTPVGTPGAVRTFAIEDDIDNSFNAVTVEGSDDSDDSDDDDSPPPNDPKPAPNPAPSPGPSQGRRLSNKQPDKQFPVSKNDKNGISSTKAEKKSDPNGFQMLRGSMGADEEKLRSSRFRNQLSKKSEKNLQSKIDTVEMDDDSTPPFDKAPPSPSLRVKLVMPPSRDVTPKRGEWGRDKGSLKSDVEEEGEFTGELSMEEFSHMMDTLAMQPAQSKSGNETDVPIDVTLKTTDFSSQLRNTYNGIGMASYSEKGLREYQEDRCCLVPDVAEMLIKDGGNQSPGSDDVNHKITMACLFDGHSGSVCSEYMSKHFANMLIHHEKFLDKNSEAALIDVCRRIDGKV